MRSRDHCGDRIRSPAASACNNPGPRLPPRAALPAAIASDRLAARIVAGHPEQGWSLLCNGIITFDDSGALTPGGNVIAPPAAAAA